MPPPGEHPSDPQRERRTVEVHEPEFSEATNAKLTDELRDVIGADQVEVPVDGAQDGYGLGLNIVKRLAHLLKLELQVRSEEGRGSAFSIVLPAVTAVLNSGPDVA